MKRVVIVLFLCCAAFCLHAQLTGSRWSAKINTGQPTSVILDFGGDTCSLYTVADSTIIEIMRYAVKDSSITFYKIDGQSDCETTTPGIYKFAVKDNALVLHLVKDDCDDRSSTVDNVRWSPWVTPVEVKVDNAILKQYAGTYQHDDTHPIYITFNEGRLWIEGPNNNLPKVPMLTESPSRFFIRIAGVHWDFVKDAAGNVVKAISHEDEDFELKKVK